MIFRVRGVELADVCSQVLKFLFAELVPSCSSKERWEGFLQDGVFRHIGRNFAPLESRLVNEGEFRGSGEAEKIGQALQKTDIARRRVHPALDLAPIAWI
jgi:hypothetical protein